MNVQTAPGTAPRAATRVKGPIVWLNMDQKELDDAYDQEVYAPNRDQVVARRHAASERARAILGQPERVAYGPSEYEQLDIFRAATPNAPVNIFIHGGAWRRNTAADYALQAEPLVRAGAHAVLIDFINVDQAGSDLLPMYEQVSRAIAWTWRNAEKFGGDRERFYLSAHSSGSHLAGCALTVGWREQNLPENFCKGAILASGMYELAPVRLSKRSSYVAFTDAMVEKLSCRAPSRRPAYAAHSRPRHLRDAGISAPDPRLYGRRQSARQAGRAPRRRGLQPFRIAGNNRQSVRPARPRDAWSDGIDLGRFRGLGRAGLCGSSQRGADQFGAAAPAGINGVFDVLGQWAVTVEDHASCADRAGHHQGRKTRRGGNRWMAHSLVLNDRFMNYLPFFGQSQEKLCIAHISAALRDRLWLRPFRPVRVKSTTRARHRSAAAQCRHVRRDGHAHFQSPGSNLQSASNVRSALADGDRPRRRA